MELTKHDDNSVLKVRTWTRIGNLSILPTAEVVIMALSFNQRDQGDRVIVLIWTPPLSGRMVV